MPFKDFDAYVSAVRKEPITFKFREEMYEIPGDIPFFTKLRLAKLMTLKGAEGEMSISDLYDLLVTIFGEENTKRLEQSGASDQEINAMLGYVSNAYSGTADESPKVPKGKKAAQH